jgi:hypothetical protein
MKNVTFKNKSIDVSATIRFQKALMKIRNMLRLYVHTPSAAVKNKQQVQFMLKN